MLMNSTKGTFGALLVLIALGVVVLRACTVGAGERASDLAESSAPTRVQSARVEDASVGEAAPSALQSGNEEERDDPMGTEIVFTQNEALQSADPASIDQTNPDQVADLFVRTICSLDARTDTSASAGLMRARSLMSADLAAAYADGSPSGGVGLMTSLAEHDGYTLVSISAVLDGQPEDTPTTAMRGRSVTRTPTGRDGWSGAPEILAYFLTMTFEDGAWRVSQMSVG